MDRPREPVERPLTPKQRHLKHEIEEIASIISMDHWNILDYEQESRTTYLECDLGLPGINARAHLLLLFGWRRGRVGQRRHDYPRKLSGVSVAAIRASLAATFSWTARCQDKSPGASFGSGVG